MCILIISVALNFQTASEPMQLLQAKFMDNGGCGYLLKPGFLLPGTFYMYPWWSKNGKPSCRFCHRSFFPSIDVLFNMYVALCLSVRDLFKFYFENGLQRVKRFIYCKVKSIEEVKGQISSYVTFISVLETVVFLKGISGCVTLLGLIFSFVHKSFVNFVRFRGLLLNSFSGDNSICLKFWGNVYNYVLVDDRSTCPPTSRKRLNITVNLHSNQNMCNKSPLQWKHV